MRIAHAVTLISDSGAYGGPVTVATGQLSSLARRGHHVVIVSLWDGGHPPAEVEGVKLVSSRARTWIPGARHSGLFSWSYPFKVWRVFRSADLVQVHTGRDLASLTALSVAALLHKPVVVQTHGMMEVRHSRVARAFDFLMRPLLARASAALVLTQDERGDLQNVLGARTPPLIDLPNGIALSGNVEPPADVERLADNSSSTITGERPPTVVFLARLHPRKRPEVFVQAAAMVHRLLPQVVFDLYGPDGGSLELVMREISDGGLEDVVRYRGAISHQAAVRTIRDADLYVLPSVNEPFPMSLLEALSVGTAVVCTDSTGISALLVERGAAMVTDGSPDQIAEATTAVLSNPELRSDLIRAGRRAVEEAFSIEAVAERLEQIYGAAVAGAAPETVTTPHDQR